MYACVVYAQVFRAEKLHKILRPRLSTMDVMKQVVADPNSGVKAFVSRELGTQHAAALAQPDADISSGSDADEESASIRLGGSNAAAGGTSQDGLYTFIATSMYPGVHKYQVQILPPGFAMKPGGMTVTKQQQPAGARKKAKFTTAQLRFLEWCYNRGVESKADKMSPHLAQILMPLHGTIAGQLRFPADEFWLASRVVNKHGKPKCTFRVTELLDHWSFRPWFSQQKGQFDAKIASALKAAPASAADVCSGSEEEADVEPDYE